MSKSELRQIKFIIFALIIFAAIITCCRFLMGYSVLFAVLMCLLSISTIFVYFKNYLTSQDMWRCSLGSYTSNFKQKFITIFLQWVKKIKYFPIVFGYIIILSIYLVMSLASTFQCSYFDITTPIFTFIILLTMLILGVVFSAEKISLIFSFMEVFEILFNKYQLSGIVPTTTLLTNISSIGNGVAFEFTGSIRRGLLETVNQKRSSLTLAKKNGFPVAILNIQKIKMSLLAGYYWVIRNVNVAFWVLSAMITKLYLAMYKLFASAICFCVRELSLSERYRISGKFVGVFLLAGLGFIGFTFAQVGGFLQPTIVTRDTTWMYVGFFISEIVLFVSLFLSISIKKPSWKLENQIVS